MQASKYPVISSNGGIGRQKMKDFEYFKVDYFNEMYKSQQFWIENILKIS